MELQLSTKQAQDALQALDAKLGALAQAFTNFGAADTALDRVGKAMKNIPALDASVVTGLNSLSKAVNNLSKIDKLSTIATGLENLSKINVNAAATGVQALATALGQIRVPRNLERLGQNIAKIGNEAQMGARGVASFGVALNTIRGGGLGAAAAGLTQIGGAARGAANDVNGFYMTWRTMVGVLGAAGITTGVAGLVNFGKEAVNASISVDQFKIKMDSVSGTAGLGAEAMGYLNEAATRLGLPLQTSIEQFGKLSAAMLQSGSDMDDVKRVYEGFGSAFRVLGSTSEQVKRGFNAVAQSFQKGTVSSDELKQQLGEIIPAFGMLADSLGVNGEELSKMLMMGQVESAALLGLADRMAEKFGPGLKAALMTAQGALNAFENALFRVSTVAGSTFLQQGQAAIRSFALTLESVSMNNLITSFAALSGVIANVAASAFTMVVDALNMIAVAGQLVVAGFQAIGSAATFMVGGTSNAAAIMSVLSSIFSTIGTPIMAVTIAWGAYVAAVWTVNSAMSAATGIINAFSSPVFRTLALVVGLSAALVVLGAAGYAAYQWAVNGKPFVETFNGALSAVGGSIRGVVANMTGMDSVNKTVGNSFMDIATATDQASASYTTVTQMAGQATNSAGQVVDGFGNAAGAATGLATEASTAAEGVQSIATPTQQAATAATTLATDADKAATSISDLGSNASSASGSLSSTAGSISSVASSASNAIGPVNALTSALNDLAAAKTRAGGGGGGGDVTVDSFAGGGTTNAPSSRTQSAPMSAFVNAPKLATGVANTNSLPGAGGMGGGGIPAVLHPNEAVVPLAGGGAIPVVSNGADSGLQAALYQVAEDTLRGVRAVDESINRVWEQVNAQTAMQIQAFKAVNTNLVELHNNMLTLDASVNLVTEAVKAIKISSGGGGGGGGGGGSISPIGSGGGSSPSQSDMNAALNQLREMRQQSEQISLEMNNLLKTKGFKWGTGNGPVHLGVQDQATYDGLKLRQQQQQENISAFTKQNQELLNSAYIQQWRELKRKGEDIPQALEDTINHIKSQNGGRIGFATGSPNASRDMMGGGFTATLHPDEAVIPLPDGRTVPVSFPEGVIERMAGAREQSSGPKQIVVNMNVYTPDADSFRASKNQIINDLRANIDRAAQKAGPPRRRVEDPTKKLA